MKKRIGLIFVVLLVALLAAALVACDPDPSNPLSPENPSQSTYTVTFDLNGALWEYDEALAPITGVKYGATIDEPLFEGKPIVPTKRGYEFKGWIANNETFIFGANGTKIVSNTTIRANFEAKKYYHIPDVCTTVSYDTTTGKYVLDPNGHAAPGLDTDVLTNSLGEEVKDGNGNTISVPKTDITFAEGAIGENTTIYSTYNATTPSRITVPSRTAAEGEEKDNFCFWYYMADTLGEDGKPLKDSSGATVQHPVQFTEWASKDATDVAVRKISYTYDKPLTLYAMFESDLPFVTVEYYDNEESTTPALRTDSEKYHLGDKIPETDKLEPDNKADSDFNYWYFVYLTENEKEGEDPVRNVQKFVFETFDEDGNSLNKDSATSPMDAAHDDDIPEGEQNFRPVTLKLYANWVKRIEIGSANDYNTKLATPIGELISQLSALKEGDPGFEEKQKALDEYLTATIKFTADINFEEAQLSPLFDAAHPFAGIIDGGNYTEGSEGELTLSGSHTLSNATVTGTTFASLFGYVNGAVKNLTVDNIALSATSANAELSLGALASVSGGSLTNCVVTNITFTLPQNAGLTYIGGLAGKLSGTSNDEEKGTISECKVTLTLSGLTASGLHIGALVGESGSSTAISNCTATLTVSEVKTTAEFSGLMIGAVAGNSVANVSACEATLTINENVLASGTAYVGGLIGHNEGSISKSHATFNTSALSLGSTASLQLLAVGGFVGRNEGDIINSYSTAHITFTLIANQDAHIGGFVGLNSTSRTDNQSDKEKGLGAINRCYSEGSVTVSADAAVIKSADLYVGGMIGLSKHSKFANNFTLVNVTVTYKTDKTDLIHAGFLFGALDKDASITSGYYANNGKVTVNDTTYNGSEFAPKEEGDSADEQTTESEICSLGTPRDKTDFADKKIVFGTNTDDIKYNLGWAGGNEDASKNIWELKDEAAAPTLIGIGFPQKSQEG